MTSYLLVRIGDGPARLARVSPQAFSPKRRFGILAILLSVILLAGCTGYTPAPRSIETTAEKFAVRSVSLAQAATICRRLAPTAPCDPQQPDRLLLLAAATRNNPDVAVARAHVRSAEAAARAARSAQPATLTLSTEYARASDAASPWLLGAGLDAPLDIGGRRSARLSAADLDVVAARYDLAEAIWAARMSLVRALNASTIATRQQSLGTLLLELQQRRLSAAQRRAVAGEIAVAEVERVRSDLADARRRVALATAAGHAAQIALAKVLGAPAAVLPPLAVESQASGMTAVPNVDPTLRANALLSRPDLHKAIVEYDRSEADLRSEVAKQYPALSIGPGFTWERGLVKLPFNLGLALPPLDLNRSNIRAAEARRAEAGEQLESAYASAFSAIDAADAERRAAIYALRELQRTDLVIAARIAKQASNELAAGAIDRTEWGAGQAGLLGAKLAELDANDRLLAAEAGLEDALRRPLSGPELLIKGPVE